MLAKSNKVSSVIGGLTFTLFALGVGLALWHRDSSLSLYIIPVILTSIGLMLIVWSLNGSQDLKVDKEGIRLFNMNFPWQFIASAEIFRDSLEGHDQTRFMTIKFSSPVKLSRFQKLKSRYVKCLLGKKSNSSNQENGRSTFTCQINETDASDCELNSTIENYLANNSCHTTTYKAQ